MQVEAIIVEVLEGDNVDFGIQWISENGGLVQYNTGNQVPIGSLAAAAYQARPREVTSVTTVNDNGQTVTTTNPEERGNLETSSELAWQRKRNDVWNNPK